MEEIGIVGGGVIGSAVAVWLAGEGRKVVVFERDPDGKPASAGNAGLIALPEISPLARPGILLSTPRWIADPLGPLSLRWRDAAALAPWLLAFAAAARPHRIEAATRALAFLMKTALADHQELGRRARSGAMLRRTGALHLFDSEASHAAGVAEWRERARYGVEFHDVAAGEARALAPALLGPFARALMVPGYWAVSGPAAFLGALRARLEEAGSIERAEVRSLRPSPDAVVAILADGSERRFDRVVVAGGIWSREIVMRLGLRLLLETERGYNLTFATPPFDLALPVFFADHGFVVSPLEEGLRVGGAVELASPEAPPNFARAEAMLKKARRYFPALPEEGGRQWMGRRPSTPDSLPVIGRHPAAPRIVFAFGHGHLGLTLSAVTARHVAALLGGTPPDPQLSPFGIERF